MSRYLPGFLVPAGIFLLLPFIYALGFCFPQGDDFDSATRSMFLFDFIGGIYEIGREWLSWSGRYTYHFLAVFLGKAAHMRIAAGLVCGSVIALYLVSIWGLAKLSGCRLAACCLYSLYCLLAILCFWNTLPNFYLFTDALTICLQGAASLFFFFALFNLQHKLANKEDAGKSWWLALGSGIFAIGVFEHAALAVFFGIFAAFCPSLRIQPKNTIFFKERPNKSGLPPEPRWGTRAPDPSYPLTSMRCIDIRGGRGSGLRQNSLQICFNQPLLKLGLWLSLFVAFSFFAPGNFRRRIVREASFSFEHVFEDLAFSIKNFIFGPWPLAAVLLALLLLFLAGRGPKQQPPANHLFQALSIFVAGALFTFFFVLLHAQSDVPIQSAPKLISSLSLYLCFAIIMIVYQLAQYLPEAVFKNPIKNLAIIFICAGLWLQFFTSQNFKNCAFNAANGQLIAFEEFMQCRIDYLLELGKKSFENERYKFGLLGEIYNPNSRKPQLDQKLPEGIVAIFDGTAFPVWEKETLQAESADWPNKWAAWLYGLSGVKCKGFDIHKIFVAAQSGKTLELPIELRDAGLNKACSLAVNGDNPTFACRWLTLEFKNEIPQQIYLYRPNPVSWKRLLPMPIQRYCLENSMNAPFPSILSKLSATFKCYDTAKWRLNNNLVLPIEFIGKTGTNWPPAIYVSLDGKKFFAIQL